MLLRGSGSLGVGTFGELGLALRVGATLIRCVHSERKYAQPYCSCYWGCNYKWRPFSCELFKVPSCLPLSFGPRIMLPLQPPSEVFKATRPKNHFHSQGFWSTIPRAPSYINSGLLGFATIRYMRPRTHYLG